MCLRPGEPGQAGKIVADCVKQHEERHLQQNPQCPDCKTGPKVDQDEKTEKRNECEAYRIEVACLRKKRRECQTRDCREKVDAAIAKTMRVSARAYGCKW